MQPKPYIYRNKGFLTEQQVGEILSSIQSAGKKIKNRTQTSTEYGDWGKTYPLPPLPLGKSFVLAGLMEVDNGHLPVRFLKEAKLEFFQRVVDEISPYGNIHFDVGLKHRTIALKNLVASLAFEKSTAYVGFRYSHYRADEGSAEAHAKAAQQVIGLAKLPLNLTIRKKSFILSHTEKKGELFRPPTQLDEPPTIIKGSLPGLTLAEVIAKYLDFIQHPEFQAGNGEWSIGFPQFDMPKPKDPVKLYDAINSVGFPGKTAKANILWHLKDYTFYKDMPLMAELKGEEVVQTLFEFEFGSGKPCQLDALCQKKGKYKLYFSFNQREDSVPLAELLKLRLELY